jgi:hypothetical protein
MNPERLIINIILEIEMFTTFVTKNQNAKNFGNFTTLLKPHNIGIHLNVMGRAFRWYHYFEILPLLDELYHFLKFSQNTGQTWDLLHGGQ